MNTKTNIKQPYKMMTLGSSKFYIFLNKVKEDRGKEVLNTVDKTFIGPFTSEKLAHKVSDALRIYNKNIRKGCMSINIVNNKETEDTIETWHVEYCASVLGKKINKMLEQGNNPHEWVRDFVVKLCDKNGVLSSYKVNDFKTNLPHIPTIFEPITNANQALVINKTKQIVINNSNKINPKIKLTPQQIMQNKQEKKQEEERKREADKMFKQKQQESIIRVKLEKTTTKTANIVVDKEY